MTTQPWMKFYPSDWRSDPRLRMCSLGARGLWMEMLMLMHEATPYGHLIVAGRSPSNEQLAILVGTTPDQIPAYLSELEIAEVFSRNSRGTIYSRRMTRDDKKARTARKNGQNGGNPSLCKQTENQASVNPHIPEARIPEPERKREGKPSLGESDPPLRELFEGVEVVDAEVIEPTPEADPKIVRMADRQALLDKQFDEFWAAYPHKVGKQAAIKCYAKARKTASHDQIMHGLANALPAFRRCSETRFIPHPKTWLNEGRWDDVITSNGSSNYGRSGFNDRAERNGFISLDRTIESCSV